MELVTVAICTHNRQKDLMEAIHSVKKCLNGCVPKILVIDSSDKKLPKKYRKNVEYIYSREHKPVSDKRNIAIRLAKTRILAFIDDDCIVSREWVKSLTEGFKEGVSCVVGRTLPIKGLKEGVYEKIFSFDMGKKLRNFKKHIGIQNPWELGHGNNIAFLLEDLKKIRGFDPELGVGSEGLSGEDRDVLYRIYKTGKTISYCPKAILYHKHPTDKRYMLKVAYRNGYGSNLFLFKEGDFNCLFFFVAGIAKIMLDILLSSGFKRRINIETIRGWLKFKESDYSSYKI